MQKFSFLIGHWNLQYKIPKGELNEAATGTGTGTFQRALDEKYVFFDYSSLINGQQRHAHVVFAFNETEKNYRMWWFESSGHYRTATCNFINDETLLIHWHDTLLRQTFQKTGQNQVILSMEAPKSDGHYDPILKVTFTKHQPKN